MTPLAAAKHARQMAKDYRYESKSMKGKARLQWLKYANKRDDDCRFYLTRHLISKTKTQRIEL